MKDIPAIHMDVVVARPPNYHELVAAFPDCAKPGTVFTFGSVIYNPSGRKISMELCSHEGTHGMRQGHTIKTIEDWWRNYIADPAFRLQEEIVAHQAEYSRFCQRFADGNKRVKFLMVIATRLSSPLYGGVISHTEAMKRIREGKK